MDKLRRPCTTPLALGLLAAPPLLPAATDPSADARASKVDVKAIPAFTQRPQ
jgi:hypothetical protein